MTNKYSQFKASFRQVFVLTISCLLFSCSNPEDKIEETKKEITELNGKYIRVDEIKIETLADAVGGFGLIGEITFYKKNCEFSYVGLTMSGSYSIESDKVFINAGGQIGNLSMKVINENRLEGFGYINGIFVKENSDELKKLIEEQK